MVQAKKMRTVLRLGATVVGSESRGRPRKIRHKHEDENGKLSISCGQKNVRVYVRVGTSVGKITRILFRF